jgi:hypothetical protein
MVIVLFPVTGSDEWAGRQAQVIEVKDTATTAGVTNDTPPMMALKAHIPWPLKKAVYQEDSWNGRMRGYISSLCFLTFY